MLVNDAIAGMPPPVYSLLMKRAALLTLLAGILAVNTLELFHHETPAGLGRGWWAGFLVLLPFSLGVLVGGGFRWAAMASVMYGTVALAIDLATTIQILEMDQEAVQDLTISFVSGLLNFLLIVVGGRSFLDVAQAPPHRESHPPSPPPSF